VFNNGYGFKNGATRDTWLKGSSAFCTFQAGETYTGGSVNNYPPLADSQLPNRRQTSVNNSQTTVERVFSSTVPWDYATYPHVELLVYVDDVANFNYLQVMFSMDDTYTKYVGGAISTTNFNTGWNVVRLPSTGFSLGGGALITDLGAIKRFRLAIKSTLGTTVNLYWAHARFVKMAPIILLDHDDGLADQKDLHAIEDANGLHSTNFVLPNIIGTADHLTWAECHAAEAAGHTIASHTNNHVAGDWTAWGAGTGDSAVLATAIEGARDLLLANGFTKGIKVMSTPYGTNSVQVRTEVAKYHNVMRAQATQPSRYPVLPNTTLTMGGYGNFDYSTNIATVKGYVDSAIATGGISNLLVHGHSEANVSGKVSTAYYTELCEYIAAKIAAGDCLNPTWADAIL